MLLRFKLYPWIIGAVALLMAGCSQADEHELPAAVKALQAQGLSNISEFDVGGGLRAFAGAAGDQPVAVYVTGDGSAVIGTRIGPNGAALDDSRLEELVIKPLGERSLLQLQEATWVLDGDKDAPRVVYTFSDPNCPYCNRFWEDARPWVESGAVQLRHLVVAVIRPDSATKAAAILDAKDRSAALSENEEKFSAGGIKPASKVSPVAQKILDDNQILMLELGFRGTPGIVAMGDDGLLQKINGMPQPDALAQLLGPRPGSASTTN
jgi:thiol:disulfide interchange protein DsbG